MAAPKGNKYALGHGIGRPNEHDVHQIAVDLVVWSRKEDSINLCGFCAENEIPPSLFSRWEKESDVFAKAFRIAKVAIGARRERKVSEGTLHSKCYDLNASVYDHFLRQEKRDQMEFEALLKAQEQKQYTDEDEGRLQALMNQLSDLNKASKSSKRDKRSD